MDPVVAGIADVAVNWISYLTELALAAVTFAVAENPATLDASATPAQPVQLNTVAAATIAIVRSPSCAPSAIVVPDHPIDLPC
jgi:hypothetical protein